MAETILDNNEQLASAYRRSLRRGLELSSASGLPESLGMGIACRVYNSANLSVVTATVTTVTYDTELYDSSNMHSTSATTGRITITIPGFYIFGASHEWADSAVGVRYSWIYLNGANRITAHESASVASTAHSITGSYFLNAADFLTCAVYQTSGGNLNLCNAASAPSSGMAMNFWAARIA